MKTSNKNTEDKIMTQQERVAKANIERWMRSNKKNITQAYKKPSIAKRRAWHYCEELCANLNGSNLKVVSNNCHFFTAGFQFVDKDTGVLKYMHITANHDTAVEM